MKLKIAALLTLVAIGFLVYLTFHYYDLSLGLVDGSAVCNISSKFNCDNVSASRYAELFGIPIALWGAVTNLILLLMLITQILDWSADKPKWSRLTFYLALFIAAVSIIMGTFSTFFVGSFCIFCIGAYVISFINFELIWRSQEPDRQPDKNYLSGILQGQSKAFMILMLLIPAGSWVANSAILDHYGASQLDVVVNSAFLDWKSSPVLELNVPALLTKGHADSHPKMTISEFADFRCGHCKHAAVPLSAFAQSHPDVQVKYFSFPLDGTCNEAVGPAGDGISCYLAKAVFCAEKLSGKGWAFHDQIYEMQDDINKNSSLSFAQEQIEKLSQKLGVNPDIKNCIDGKESDDAIRAQARLGQNVGVKGTPSFFVNGRKLERGQLIPVLDKVYREL